MQAGADQASMAGLAEGKNEERQALKRGMGEGEMRSFSPGCRISLGAMGRGQGNKRRLVSRFAGGKCQGARWGGRLCAEHNGVQAEWPATVGVW